jgi:hypothetical protein
MSKPIMTSEEYIAREGCPCPFCGEEAARDYHDTDFEGNPLIIAQLVECTACHAEWWDEYRLASYALPEKEDDYA